MSDSETERREDSDVEIESEPVPAPKRALKPLSSMEDIMHPVSDSEKAQLKKAGQKTKKLSDFIQRRATKIVVSSRRKPDPANAIRKLDKKKKKIIAKIPTKEVKMVTIERELSVKPEVKSSSSSDNSSSSRSDRDLALDYAEEIFDKADDLRELVVQLADDKYYDDYKVTDDLKTSKWILQLLDHGIANANRNINEMKQMKDRKRKAAESEKRRREKGDEEEDSPPPPKRQKSKSSSKKKD